MDDLAQQNSRALESAADVDTSRHDEVYTLRQEDVLPVAKLFNQVGSALTSVDKHNVNGVRAMQLDENKVLNVSTPSVQDSTMAMPQQPVIQNHPGISAIPVVTNNQSVSFKDLERIQKVEKKLTLTSKKITTLDKKIEAIDEILKLPSKIKKYKIVSDNTECTTTNINTLLTTLSNELQSGCQSITIQSCK